MSADAFLRASIQTNSLDLVGKALEEGAAPNAPSEFKFCLAEYVSRGSEDDKFSAATKESTVLVPPLHQAVRNCYDMVAGEETLSHYHSYPKFETTRAFGILKLLIDNGANVSNAASFWACYVGGNQCGDNDNKQNWKGFEQVNVTPAQFALFLKSKPNFPASYNGYDENRYDDNEHQTQEKTAGNTLKREWATQQKVAMDTVISALMSATEPNSRSAMVKQLQFNSAMVSVPLSTKTLWSSLLFSGDMRFECKGTAVHAHKVILAAASPYFQTLFDGPWRENADSCIKSHMPPEAIKAMLTFLYTGDLDSAALESQTSDLFDISSAYQLEELKMMCEHHCLGCLSIENAIGFLELGTLYECEQLESQCFAFIRQHASKMLLPITQLAQENKSLWTKLCATCAQDSTMTPQTKKQKLEPGVEL
jgi:hypothetical protein